LRNVFVAICILVLEDEKGAYELWERLKAGSTQITKFQVIAPDSKIKDSQSAEEKPNNTNFPMKLSIKDVKLLNPQLSRKDRQKKMSLWLMPFGFIAGLTFAGMTNLQTFAKFGFNSTSETLIGGLLGMLAGLIGSFFGARSVNTFQEDLKSLFKRNEQGQWLILIETPLEVELPWPLIKKIEPIEIVNINTN